jgi:pyruvate kinase
MRKDHLTTSVATLSSMGSDGAATDSLSNVGAYLFSIDLSHGAYADHSALPDAIREVEKRNSQLIVVHLMLSDQRFIALVLRVGVLPLDTA